MTVKLSKRLQLIADLVPRGARLADIGSDHALLPVHLAQSGVVALAVAGEVNPGPLEAAKRQVAESGQGRLVDVRGGNGLAVIGAGEVDTITIAGMGGGLIATILEEGKAKLDGVSRLILQPNVGEELVRRWLDSEGWLLTSETIIEEDGKIYEILTAERGSAEALAALYARRTLEGGLTLDKPRLQQLGPFLVGQKDEVWFRKWESELDKLAMIRRQLGLSESEASKNKALELEREINDIREVLLCLQKVKR
ncbi:tRNA (adenine(22)-N(1))-methyltransferase TrmK [Paenibacillus athensensis]|uniref:tRNA (Adenine-N(1))-methyltransferase n=1 Tax=Paenibacillus athensensis TaxID=1967502 RepID=A0A4Y8PT17_9BACL|nr:tRNA (adenine(22)-N(1))-methyltransferase TrmK [Paenibacillus athensensis]MCD1261559.1 tRNA (adenine(22)-N(1))-methyltransferase TrmK [Paenibacillus athensensis]